MKTRSSSGPRISVIIPTRERCETLRSTLQTCVDQDYGNCEIIVSDNFSQDDTQTVVAGAMDSRVRYVNTGRRLSMSHNWEYALSQATGDYLTVIGDDDGLLPGALSSLAAIVTATGTRAISWNFASYFWPNCIHAPSRNLLVVPCINGLERRSGPEMLRRALAFEQGYVELPYFYKGLIRSDLVNTVKERSGGVFFHSQVPDIYSAIALSIFADEYHYSLRPFSVNGTSGASAGAAHFSPSLNARPAKDFLSEANIPFHPDLAFAPSLAMGVAESFLQARERIAEARSFSLDIALLLEAALREAATAEEQRYLSVVSALEVVATKAGLSSEMQRLRTKYPNRPRKLIIGLEEGYNVLRKTHIVDCSRFGIRTIHQAAPFCAAILEAAEMGFVRNPVAIAKTTAALANGFVKRAIVERRGR